MNTLKGGVLPRKHPVLRASKDAVFLFLQGVEGFE